MKMKSSKERIECLKCRSLKAASNFYVNANPLFASDKLSICKPCINSFIGEKNSEGYLERVKMMLAIMNRPLLKDLWIEMDVDWNRYIRTVSSLTQYSSLTYKDSDFLKYDEQIERLNNITDDFVQEVHSADLAELTAFWGRGYSTEDLLFLQNEYEKLLNSYECDTYAMEMLFQEVAHLRLAINKKRLKNESVDKELKTLQDLLGSANIKPVQETGANAAEQSTFGTLIKKWEMERPIPEPDEAWKDVDGIGKYMHTWFFGHLSKLVGSKGVHTEAYEAELEKYTIKPPQYEESDD
jgi:hypothetical protein